MAALLARRGPFGARAALAAGLVTFAPDDIDWDDEVRLAIEERAAMSPDALTGMEASLRFVGPETLETKIFGRLSAWQNWIFTRPNSTGEKGALTVYGKAGQRPGVRLATHLSDRPARDADEQRLPREKIPNNVDLSSDKRLQRALEQWQPGLPRLVARDGAGRLPGRRRLPAHRDLGRRRAAGRTSAW